MSKKRVSACCATLAFTGLAAVGLYASQHKGTVLSGNQPIPGATVTATQGEKRVVTTTDDHGVYSFQELADGVWSIQVDMLGFEGAKREIGVAPDAASQTWILRFLSEQETMAALAARPAPAQPASSTGLPATVLPVTQAAPPTPATAPSPPPATPAAVPAVAMPPAASATNDRQAAGRSGRAEQNSATAAGTASGRGAQSAAGRGGVTARGGRGQTMPQGRGAQAPAGQTTPGYQQVTVTQSTETSLFSEEGAISTEQSAELAPSANEAFVVQGSMSAATGLPGQADFGPFGGRGGPGGPEMMGMGGPGGMGLDGGGFNLGGDNAAAGGDQNASAMGGGRGGAGGPGGAPGIGGGRGGAGGGGGGGFAGGGGRGGGGAGGGRGGGPAGGGRGGPAGRGGPGGRGPNWMGMNNALAFGNNRRNRRMLYTGNLSVNERNSLLNARSYSISGNNIDKPYSNNTSVNATFGGPLMIPKLLSGNRGQFTFGFGVTRGRNANAGQLTTMPTDLEKGGNFSQSITSAGKSVLIYDPITHLPFPNNTIDPIRITSIAKSLLAYYPRPNLTSALGVSRNYQRPFTNLSDSDSVNARLNQTLNSRNRVSGGFQYQGSNSTSPSTLGFIDPITHALITDTGTGRGMGANASYSHNFTTRAIGTLTYNFSRNRNRSLPYFAALGQNIGANLGIQGLSNDPLNWGPPSLSFSNFGGFNDGTASLTRSQTSSAGATLMWVHKSHNMSWGANFRRQQNNPYSNSNGRGSFTFNGYATSQFQNGAAVAGTGFDLADFLLATPYQASIRYTANPALYFRGSIFELSFQDDWRMTPRMSVNFGLRWEFQTPVHEVHNQLVNMAFTPAFTSFKTTQPGQINFLTGQQNSSALVGADPNNISPRLGIAWRPSAKRSTVLRAGFGLYYNSSVYSQVASRLAQQPPLVTAYNLYLIDGPLAMNTAFANASSRATNTVTNSFAVDPSYKNGYAEQWQLAIQQNLPYSFQTTVTYHGAAGRDLERQMRPWVVPPGAVQAPYPTGYTYVTFGGNSMFNSGTVQLTRRFRGGLSAGANYTFQKGIQDAGTAQDWLNYRADRAVFTSPHSLNINFSYGTGQGRRGFGLISGWKGVLIKDWNIQSSISIRSGNLLTATVGGNQGTKGGSNRADATGLPVASSIPGALFNTAAFATPAAGMWGNSGRNVIPGPLSFGLNASANRTFRLGDRERMTFSLNATNALNTVVVTGWGTALNTNTYGQPTGVSGMRTVGTSLRVNF